MVFVRGNDVRLDRQGDIRSMTVQVAELSSPQHMISPLHKLMQHSLLLSANLRKGPVHIKASVASDPAQAIS